MYNVCAAPQIVGDLVSIVYKVRFFLYSTIYNNANTGETQNILTLKQFIQEAIPCLQIEYIPNEMCFSLKIKKTALKKNSNFEHISTFYYQIMTNVLSRFFRHPPIQCVLTNCMRAIYGSDADKIFNFICGNAAVNFCNVQCYGDNIVKIYI